MSRSTTQGLVWLPCRVTDRQPLSVRVFVMDNQLRDRILYVPMSLVKEERAGAIQVPKWWVLTHRDIPYDAA